MKRFATKLLIQYRKVRRGKSSKRRPCEERTILVSGRNAESAHRKAERYGRSLEHVVQTDGYEVHCEYVGIVEMLELDELVDDNEVWWDTSIKLRPLERRAELCPPKSRLRAFQK